MENRGEANGFSLARGDGDKDREPDTKPGASTGRGTGTRVAVGRGASADAGGLVRTLCALAGVDPDSNPDPTRTANASVGSGTGKRAAGAAGAVLYLAYHRRGDECHAQCQVGGVAVLRVDACTQMLCNDDMLHRLHMLVW